MTNKFASIEEIYLFYKNDLSYYNMVFKYNKSYYFGFILLVLISFISALVIIFLEKYFLIAIPLLVIMISFLLTNHKFKEVIKNKYNLSQNNFLWGGKEFINFRTEKLKKYLSERDINSELQTKILLNILNKRIDNKKLPELFLPGFTLSFIIPLWYHFTSFVFNNINEINEAIIVFLTLLIIIISFAFAIGQIKITVLDLLNSDTNKLKELARNIEDIYFSLLKR